MGYVNVAATEDLTISSRSKRRFGKNIPFG
jgi:hypothetical protein